MNGTKKVDSVINSKVRKKVQKPRGSNKKSQLKEQLIRGVAAANGSTTRANIVKLAKQNGQVSKKLPKPGQFVRAPPKSPTPVAEDDSASDSDSEEEEYIDRFFGDVEMGGSDGEQGSSESDEESEPSEESDGSSGDEEDEEDEVGDSDEDSGECEVELELPDIAESDEDESLDEEEEEDSDSEDSFGYPDKYNLSPSDFMYEPDEDEDYSFNYANGEEISIESYSESPSSSSESDPDEYVEGQGRFVDADESKISFPSQGSGIVEIENDSDVCPDLVPIPEELKTQTQKSTTSGQNKEPKGNNKTQETRNSLPKPNQEPEAADLDYYLSQDFTHVLIHLKEPQLFFHGLLSIRVIAGSVEILHHRRSPEITTEIIAMATVDDCPVRVTVLPDPGSNIGRCLADPSLKKFHYNHLMEVKQKFSTGDAVLLMKTIDERHIQFMQGHMTKRLLPENFNRGAESVLKCKFYKSHPKEFTPVVHLQEKNPSTRFQRIITVGGKDTGKSTFNKCLVNNLLAEGNAQVLYVDLDIGQPEFGVPQTISAHLVETPIVGRGFLKCHRTEPYLCLVYGHINVALDPIRYANCVKALFDRLNRETDLTPIPWVVNTMGYVRGIGLDLMHLILTELKPTRVLQFRHPQHHLENFPTRLDSSFLRDHEATLLRSWNIELDFEWDQVNGFKGRATDEMRQMKGNEARQMNILSNLGLALNKDFATTLTEVEPIW